MTEKTCTKCTRLVALDNFYKDRSKPDGLRTWCKDCAKAHIKAYVAENREAVTAQHRKRRAEVADYRNAQSRQRRAANPEQYRKYDKTKWERHAERINQERREDRKKRTSEEIERDNQKHQESYERFLERHPNYEARRSARRKKADPNRIKEWRYRTHLRGRYGLTIDDYLAMLERQDGCCAMCKGGQVGKRKRLIVDHCHVTGKVRELLCYKCNLIIGLLETTPELIQIGQEYIARHA